jgi:hypothetical protein
MPTGALVTVVVVPDVVTGADAVMLVAPVESTLAAFKTIEATPLASVNAVAEVGVNVIMSLVAAKVTIAPCTTAPLASVSVAVAVTGVPNVTTLEEILKVREAEVVVPVPVVAPLPHPLRQQNRAKQISSSNGRRNLALIDFTILLSFF